ncbi:MULTISPECIES: hypothetical protein [unclassified Microbacterium]|uniref:hypothetical protein n=1 Tax=unclassified Microbacterium TaxID=2609290 RepID=UPI00246900C2|nr:MULTISPECIES: hypothetical protein [unclassified Microbacterium]MDH5134622.1 hypothetical protein [Microbacterium sp. RD10]MDH5138176.1 hypothetical protein [Microbacterium sp. RD11]MDH5146104.1 hypothetical protein [Microbacterium sp. RD12]MDH5156153.1 hypothetical protein [Microbacterium sp. RD06]MDH5168103.1 hypothetical protein [Microbacterium sp. RD02]
MEIDYGATVTTPDGKVGTVLQEKVHDALHFYDWSGNGKKAVTAYAVLLESGEVRFFTEAALVESDSGIRRSGALE